MERAGSTKAVDARAALLKSPSRALPAPSMPALDQGLGKSVSSSLLESVSLVLSPQMLLKLSMAFL